MIKVTPKTRLPLKTFINNGTYQQRIKYAQELNAKFYEKIKSKVVDNFIFVHAGLYLPSDLNELTLDELLAIQEEDTCLWTRHNINKERKFQNYIIVSGHSAVQGIDENSENKILYREGHIYIDCGLQTAGELGQLACLRLDDMEEFYV